jgi:hypothetical protein
MASTTLHLLERLYRGRRLRSVVPLLPFLFRLHGKPFSLNDYYPFQVFFNLDPPRKLVIKAGRQVSKTMSMAARILSFSFLKKHLKTLYVAPLYNQTLRFSTQYVKVLIEDSPVKHLFVDKKCHQSVLHREFSNGSSITFSFAYLDADRIRGVSANQCCIDECQDIDPSHLPVILAVMSAQSWRSEVYTGTPKTKDNLLEMLWQRSSQAEWAIPCDNCKYENIPCLDNDLLAMIGPYRDDISPERPGTICAKCKHPINPRHGYWLHKYPERRYDFAGYHVPQIIMPIHAEIARHWKEIVARQMGSDNFSQAKFYNEILGESYDLSTKIFTLQDLKQAAVLPWANVIDEAVKQRDRYRLVIMGVDWGGGGEEEISFTTVAIAGMNYDGKIDVIYGERLPNPNDHLGEAKRIMDLFRLFNCNYLAHDYNVAGSLRETIIIQAGMPSSVILPMVYSIVPGSDIIFNKEKTSKIVNPYYIVNKPRSIQLLAGCMKLGLLRFFQLDYKSEDERGLLGDFLTLVEHKVEHIRGSDFYTIRRAGPYPDDFVHAVNYACLGLWLVSNAWPDLAKHAEVQVESVPIWHIEEMYNVQEHLY